MCVATEYVHAGLKAHWFRHSALVRRWNEAVHTRREEMYRTLFSYRTDQQKWLDRAEQRDTAGRLGAGSFARRYVRPHHSFDLNSTFGIFRQAHRYERLAQKAETKFPAIIHEVSTRPPFFFPPSHQYVLGCWDVIKW